MSEGYEYFLKFIVVGDADVGKTCLLGRFVDGKYWSERGSTIGVDFGSRTLQVGGSRVKLHVWDTAGQECFMSITRAYYRGAAAALIVYDVTRRETFEHLRRWLSDVRAVAASPPVVAVVGNKSDLEDRRQVAREEGELLATSLDAIFFETSAKQDAASVVEVFVKAADAVLERLRAGEELSGAHLLRREAKAPEGGLLQPCCRQA